MEDSNEGNDVGELVEGRMEGMFVGDSVEGEIVGEIDRMELSELLSSTSDA